MKKTEMNYMAGLLWPRWELANEIPNLSAVGEFEGLTVYKSKDFLLAMADGSFEIGSFEIFLDDNGEAKKCGWCAADDVLLKMEDVFEWGPLPKHPAEEEDGDD